MFADKDADKAKVKPSLDALEKHFQPSTNVVYERYVFGSVNQRENETAEQYIATLRHFMATCNYGTLSDELLRDRLVLGTKDKDVRARMFRDPELTLAKAMNMCKVAELSQSQLKQIAVCYSKKDRQIGKAHKEKQSKCKYCGTIHEFSKSKCPAYGKTCSKCKKPNHFASVCQQKGRSKAPRKAKVHSVQDELSSDESVFSMEYTVKSVKARGKPLSVKLSFGTSKSDVPGTTCNIISFEDYCKVAKSKKPNLQGSDARLRFYDGSYMKPLGQATLHTNYKGKHYKLRFQVVPLCRAQKPRLSANTCEHLKLLTVNVNIKRHKN